MLQGTLPPHPDYPNITRKWRKAELVEIADKNEVTIRIDITHFIGENPKTNMDERIALVGNNSVLIPVPEALRAMPAIAAMMNEQFEAPDYDYVSYLVDNEIISQTQMIVQIVNARVDVINSKLKYNS